MFTSEYCWFARDVTAAMLVVKRQKHFSPLGTKLYFEKNSIVLTPTWPPCNVVANQEFSIYDIVNLFIIYIYIYIYIYIE